MNLMQGDITMKVVKIEKFKTNDKSAEQKIAEFLNDGWTIEAMTFAPIDGLVFVFSKDE